MVMRVYRIIRGIHKVVWHHGDEGNGEEGMSMNNIIMGSPMGVYGTMRGRAMRLYGIMMREGHEGVWHHDWG